MKVKHIVAAVAATMVAPAAMAASLTAANVIYVSGATAQTPALAKSVSNFCSGTVTTYTDSVDGKSGYVYYCSSANTTKSGLTGDFLIVKNDGGSSQGVAPVVNKTLVAFPDITNCTGGTTPIAGTNMTNVVNFGGTCAYSSSTKNVIPQVGLSDVPDTIWTARGAFTPTIPASGWTAKGTFGGQGFGVAVSDSLYLAMQQDQVAAGTLASTCATATTTVSTINATTACQPSIGKEQYTAIVAYNPTSQYHVDWSRLLNHTTLTATSAPNNTDVISVCRRTSGSGTQASSDIYFLGNPCNSLTALGGALTPTPAGAYDFSTGQSTTIAANVSYVVSEEGSTGGVKTCLSNGTTTSSVVPSAPYAIGVMSLENPQPASGWKWLKLDGNSPNVETTQKATVVNGSYGFAFDSELLFRNDTAANAQAFANKLVAELGNGQNLTTFAGIYASPLSGATPFAGQTHLGSQNGNACSSHLLGNW